MNEQQDFFSESIEDTQTNVCLDRKAVSDHRPGIEGVGIILMQDKVSHCGRLTIQGGLEIGRPKRADRSE